PEPGQHHRRAGLLGKPRRAEGDRLLGDDAGDQQPLAGQQSRQNGPPLRLLHHALVALAPLGALGHDQWPMPTPPSTGMTAPVTYPAASLASQVTATATSSGAANRPAGICLRYPALTSSDSTAVMSVST